MFGRKKTKPTTTPATPTGARQVAPAQQDAEPSQWKELTVGQLPVGKAIDKVMSLYRAYKSSIFRGRKGLVNTDKLHNWLCVNANVPCPQAEWMRAAIACIY